MMSSETLLNTCDPHNHPQGTPFLPGSGLETTLSPHHNGVMTYSQYVNGSIFSVPKFEVASHDLMNGSHVTGSHPVGHRVHSHHPMGHRVHAHHPMVHVGVHVAHRGKTGDNLVDTVYGLVKSFLG